MGTARETREAADRATVTAREADLQTKRRRLCYRRSALDAQIAALEAQREVETAELSSEIDSGEQVERQLERDREARATARAGATGTDDGDEEARS
jgi:hypothetical protein